VDASGAIKDFNTAIKLNPDEVIAYFNKGNCYTIKKDFEIALICYDKALE
jgi:tetratricopeptide (TPR) repeat protein